jgi:signal peptide peptidase SppA
MHEYNQIIKALQSYVWAIIPEKMDEILFMLNARLNNQPYEKAAARRATSFKDVKGKIAVLNIFGTIVQHADMFTEWSGGTSTENVGKVFDSLIEDSGIGAVVLNIHSPGGSTWGVQELSDKIYNARGEKPIVSVANSMAGSAAYWIGTAADEFIVTPGGDVGSIGVYAIHVDESKLDENLGLKYTIIKAGKYKAEGNPFESLSEEAIDYYQSHVNDTYDAFVGAVARNRGVTVSIVKSDFGQGRMLNAKNALSAKMVDRIATFDDVIKDMIGSRKTNSNKRASLEIKRRR